MKAAIEKILNNYVLKDYDVDKLVIDVFDSHHEGRKYYEVRVFLSSKYPLEAISNLAVKMKNSLKLLGFEEVWAIDYFDERDNTQYVKAHGYYTEK